MTSITTPLVSNLTSATTRYQTKNTAYIKRDQKEIATIYAGLGIMVQAAFGLTYLFDRIDSCSGSTEKCFYADKIRQDSSSLMLTGVVAAGALFYTIACFSFLVIRNIPKLDEDLCHDIRNTKNLEYFAAHFTPSDLCERGFITEKHQKVIEALIKNYKEAAISNDPTFTKTKLDIVMDLSRIQQQFTKVMGSVIKDLPEPLTTLPQR